MDVIPFGPLRTTKVIWQGSTGGWALTVVCKATSRLEPIESPLAEEQEAPNEEDNFWDDDQAKSLYAPSDLAPFKTRADVLVVGHAFAPHQQPVRALMARLCVGEVDKSIEVWCDRAFGSDGRLLEGPRFTKMSLRYERAAGGPGTSNPIGMRFDAPPDMYGSFAIPNLQPPGTHVGWKGDTFAPIGFGPIAPSWPGRAEKLYRFAAGFSHARWFERPLPDGIDVAYFNAAPPDQQVEALRPNERLVLENLHRDHARLVTSLPGVRPRATAERGGRLEEIELLCDTLWIDTDRATCTLVWRGRIGLRAPDEAGRIMVSTELPDGKAIGGSAASAGSTPRAGNAPPPAFGGGINDRIAILSKSIDDATATLVPALEDAARAKDLPATPFQPAPRIMGSADHLGGLLAKIPVAVLNSPAAGGETITLVARSEEAKPGDALPFQKDGASAAGAHISVPAFPGAGGIPAAQPMPAYTPSRAPGAPVPDAPQFDGAPSREPVIAPPMIGPLATPEMAQGPVLLPESPAPEPVAVPKPAESKSAEPAAPEPSPGDFELERCAALTASIARRKPDKVAILEENDLTPERWEAIERHWADAIRKETASGKTGLLKRFDAAYVEQLEKERGPIQVSEYARIAVASERGTVGEVLAELGLPKGALMRIERVWIEQTVKNVMVGERLREALAAARSTE
ncbi:MAG: DUF2169 domain-containing protein [Polyangiaceae bacterium]|nr:DUF2169 domain-containing protein [Polyangiaceae bacterium]